MILLTWELVASQLERWQQTCVGSSWLTNHLEPTSQHWSIELKLMIETHSWFKQTCIADVFNAIHGSSPATSSVDHLLQKPCRNLEVAVKSSREKSLQTIVDDCWNCGSQVLTVYSVYSTQIDLYWIFLCDRRMWPGFSCEWGIVPPVFMGWFSSHWMKEVTHSNASIATLLIAP